MAAAAQLQVVLAVPGVLTPLDQGVVGFDVAGTAVLARADLGEVAAEEGVDRLVTRIIATPGIVVLTAKDMTLDEPHRLALNVAILRVVLRGDRCGLAAAAFTQLDGRIRLAHVAAPD
jgi:hypothetical protein